MVRKVPFHELDRIQPISGRDDRGGVKGYDRREVQIDLFEEATSLWAECGRGDDALRTADAAVVLGSASVRTHYLRGRALALIGRLEEACAQMTQVLALDPDNSDARSGMSMIESALAQSVRNPWWKVW
jgi:Flp pilus assembly protein TadD